MHPRNATWQLAMNGDVGSQSNWRSLILRCEHAGELRSYQKSAIDRPFDSWYLGGNFCFQRREVFQRLDLDRRRVAEMGERDDE